MAWAISDRYKLIVVAIIACLLSATACTTSPSRHPLSLGVAADSVADVGAFSAAVSAPVSIYEWYQAWEGQPQFDSARATAAASAGALPMLTWEPWAPSQGTDQPKYALARIAAGDYDTYIASFARQVRTWGGTLALRFAHEMNGNWYPWGDNVNGNKPQDAIDAWKHVRKIFTEQGAKSVVWVWCVNAARPGTQDAYASLYPGDAQVDVVALDGYNGGTALPWGGWLTPTQIFGHSLQEMNKLTHRPLIIAETGSAEQGGDKAAWITALFKLVQANPQIRALVWFDYLKEADWRITSSKAATAAFRQAASRADITKTAPFGH